MKKILSILLLTFFATASFAQEKNPLKLLSPAEYEQEVKKEKIQFVDIRTPKEYNEGAIKGAENIDFLADGFLSKMEKFDKSKPLYIYCRSGNRSAKAAAQLSEMGFENIIDLEGGYNAWKEFEAK